jgi:DHA2 family lincomycin resistance protein-like MFS transporter
MGVLGPVVGRAYDRFGAPRLVVPGAVLMLLTLGLLTRVTPTTSPWLVLADHVVLMVALALIFTPVFTSGLSVLPPHLYAHGSAILGSLQQVAAAAGTAVVVSVMAGRAASSAAGGAAPLVAMSDGIRWGFGVGAVLAVVTVAIAWAVRTPKVDPAGAHGAPATEPGEALEPALD